MYRGRLILNHATKYNKFIISLYISALEGTESFFIYAKIAFTSYLCVINEQINAVLLFETHIDITSARQKILHGCLAP
jgi:hypothetical protein